MICKRWLIKTSGMVLVRGILAGLPSDILAGLGTLASVLHDVVHHVTVLAAIGGFVHTIVSVISTRPTKG